MAVPFAGKRVEASNTRAWFRLTAAGAVLFGPARTVLIRSARRDSRHLHAMERGWARATAAVLGADIEVSGLDLVDSTERYVVAPLHEGFVDVLCLLRLPLELVFAARDELFDWPTLGPYLEASGQPKIPTSDGPMAYRALHRGAEHAFSAGKSLVVFPQGTILGIEAAFRPGAFRIAERFERPVLPVVISGTHRVWEHPYSPQVRIGMPVRVEVLEPVGPKSIADRARSLEREMKQRALSSDVAPRRFVPERDGWWDAYPYEIDPDHPELAERVASHRALAAAS